MKINRWMLLFFVLIILYLLDCISPSTYSLYTTIIFWTAIFYYGYSLISFWIYRIKRSKQG